MSLAVCRPAICSTAEGVGVAMAGARRARLAGGVVGGGIVDAEDLVFRSRDPSSPAFLARVFLETGAAVATAVSWLGEAADRRVERLVVRVDDIANQRSFGNQNQLIINELFETSKTMEGTREVSTPKSLSYR